MVVDSLDPCHVTHVNDSDPRPMPDDVKADYRRPLRLIDLLRSGVYARSELIAMRDELVAMLVRDKGNVHLSHGQDQTRTIAQRVRIFKDPVSAICFLTTLQDYGSEEVTLPYLAQLMEPGWQAWWGSQRWSSWSGIGNWEDVCSLILSRRQFFWIIAQLGRSVIDYVSGENRRIALRAIMAAEDCVIDPTDDNHKRATSAASIAQIELEQTFDYAAGDTAMLVSAAYNLGFCEAASNVAATRLLAKLSGSEAVSYSDTLDLVKMIIAPSLVDAVRSSG